MFAMVMILLAAHPILVRHSKSKKNKNKIKFLKFELVHYLLYNYRYLQKYISNGYRSY